MEIVNAPLLRQSRRATRRLEGRRGQVAEPPQRPHEDFRVFYALTRGQAERDQRSSMSFSGHPRTVSQALELALRENPSLSQAYDIIIVHPDGRFFHFSSGRQRAVVAQIVHKLAREGVPRRAALAGAMEAAGVVAPQQRRPRRYFHLVYREKGGEPEAIDIIADDEDEAISDLHERRRVARSAPVEIVSVDLPAPASVEDAYPEEADAWWAKTRSPYAPKFTVTFKKPRSETLYNLVIYGPDKDAAIAMWRAGLGRRARPAIVSVRQWTGGRHLLKPGYIR